LPDLPRAPHLRASIVLALALAPVGITKAVAKQYRTFDEVTDDFHQILRDIPQAPRLLYLIFDHGGVPKITTPFIHFPAYVQAERGGWLSWHFTELGAAPFAYRSRSDPHAIIPPPTPVRWEWT